MNVPLLQQLQGARDLRASFFSCLANANPVPDLPVGAADQSLGEVTASGDGGTVMLLLQNTGANPMTAFHLGAVPTSDSPVAAGNAYPDMITTAQFNAGAPISGLLIAQSGNPTTLAAGASVLIVVRANGAYSLQLRGASTLGTTLRVFASVTRYSA